MSWVLPILAVALGAAFYALWARREGLLALESYRRGQLSELSATLGNLQEAVWRTTPCGGFLRMRRA